MNKNQSTLDIAEQLLKTSKKPIDVYNLFDEVSKVKEFTEEDRI